MKQVFNGMLQNLRMWCGRAVGIMSKFARCLVIAEKTRPTSIELLRLRAASAGEVDVRSLRAAGFNELDLAKLSDGRQGDRCN